jgi:hypothetical protein
MGASYDTLDLVVHGHEMGLSADEIEDRLGMNSKLIEGILARIRDNEHKRRLPLALRLSSITG